MMRLPTPSPEPAPGGQPHHAPIARLTRVLAVEVCAGHVGMWLHAADLAGLHRAGLEGPEPLTSTTELHEGDILEAPGGFVEVFLADRRRQRVFCEPVDIAA